MFLFTNVKYVYLIEKFGKSNREYSKRLKEHGNEAKVLLIIDVDNCNLVERHICSLIINILKLNLI